MKIRTEAHINPNGSTYKSERKHMKIRMKSDKKAEARRINKYRQSAAFFVFIT